MSEFIDKVFKVIDAIPDMNTLPVCPSLFSDDQEKHDCDSCEDKFDCKSCWKEAIIDAERHERIERLREVYIDRYSRPEYETRFVDMVIEFVDYVAKYELKIRPTIFIDKWECGLCDNRWIFDDCHDHDACRYCFREAIMEAYKAEIEEA